MSSFRTIIVSSNTLVSRGLMHYIQMVNLDPNIEFCSGIQDIALGDKDKVNVVFIDQQLFTPSLHVYLNKLHTRNSHCKFVALCTSTLPDDLCIYFKSNISFADTEAEILNTLRSIFDVELNGSDKVHGNQVLSVREVEVLKAVALGLTNKEISDSLSISTHTVITHRKNISAKLGIKTIAGLAVYAVLNGIISADEMHTSDN